MAIEPAAISAKPAVTIMLVGLGVPLRPPVNPAASANGTVKPSDMPMTTSRTTSPAVKWRSICGVCGMGVSGREAKVERLECNSFPSERQKRYLSDGSKATLDDKATKQQNSRV